MSAAGDAQEEEEEEWVGDDALPSSRASTVTVLLYAEASNRAVLHVDLDCFYAQVEELLHPEYAGRPLGVLQRTFLVTCNYPARARGVRKLMPLFQAQCLCPEIAVVPSVMEHYRDASRCVFTALRSHGLTVEQASIDEAYLEDTDTATLVPPAKEQHTEVSEGPWNQLPPETVLVEGATPVQDSDEALCAAARLASRIRTSVKSATGLTCTIGVARNKALAKLASTLHKPDRVSLLLPSALPSLFTRLPLQQLPTIGPKIATLLLAAHCTTVASVAALSDSAIQSTGIGLQDSLRVSALARGIDPRPVRERGAPRTVSVEQSFIGGARCVTWEDLEAVLRERAALLAIRLASDQDLFHRDASTLAIRYRLGYAPSVTRSMPFPTGAGRANADSQQAQPLIATVAKAALSLMRRNVPLASLSTITRLGIAASAFTAHASPRASIERFLVRTSTPTSSSPLAKLLTVRSSTNGAKGNSALQFPAPRGIKRFLLPSANAPDKPST